MAAFLFLCVSVFGCASSHRSAKPQAAAGALQSVESQYVSSVDARAVPPVGWHSDPLKQSAKHTHQVWISPSGHTAYGIIRFQLPLPVGHDLALWGFLQTMKASEGEATLVSKKWDAGINAMRFVAVGGLYTVRTNLYVRGSEGWAVYAGTLRKEQIESDELAQAEHARELTMIGH